MPSQIAQTLPLDILREIFDHAAAAQPAGRNPSLDTYNLGWIIVTHVCQRWRYAGLSAASLWADAVCAFPDPTIADELITRARTCPLNLRHIFHDEKDTGARSYRRSPQLTLSWALRYRSRARHLQCYISMASIVRDEDAEVKILFADPLPIVEDTSIMVDDNLLDFTTRSLFIAQLNAPVLGSASLFGMLPAPTSTLPNLRTLRLYLDDIHATTIVDMADILNALRALPALESLNLRLNDAVESSVDGVSVRLEHLRFFQSLLRPMKQ
ncbi:unnamed protein product [Peniophora sp. CBMAI 1063]|nr:unnamed protein product [Peniophora sp. CBMAI 1063]